MSRTIESVASDSPRFVYRGIKEITGFVGINPNRFGYYKDKLGLPVFKTDESSKVWLATQHDLVEWVEKRRSVYFGETV